MNLPRPDRRTRIWLVVLTLFALSLVAYGNSLNNGFLLDDYLYFFNKTNLLHASFSSLFTEGFRDNYRPLGFAALRLERLAFKDNPFGYHAVNLLLLGAAGLLTFFIAFALSGEFGTSFLAGALFIAHPINNLLVNYKSSVMLLLFPVFMQISTLLALRSLESRDRTAYLASLLFYFFSLLCHEISFILPLFIFIIFYFAKDVSWKKNLAFCWPYALVLLAFLLLRYKASTARPIEGLLHLQIPLSSFITTSLQLIAWYCSKLFFPREMIFMIDTFPVQEGLLAGTVFFLWIFALLILLVFFRWKKGANACALALFSAGFIAFIPAGWVYVLQYKTVLIETHWFSFGLMGFFLLIARALASWSRFLPARARVTAAVVLVLSLALWTRASNPVWKDEETFCAYWSSVSPADLTARVGSANAYIVKHDRGLNKDRYASKEEIQKLIAAFKTLGFHQRAEDYSTMLSK